MPEYIIVYVTCSSKSEAENIGRYLLQKRLTACINIIPEMTSSYFWPPKEDKLDKSEESILLIKAKFENYEQIESEVLKIHSYDNPAFFAIPLVAISKKYADWIDSETK